MREDLETRDREFPNPTRRFWALRLKAEGSQICDLRVQPSRSEGGCDFMRKVDATLYLHKGLDYTFTHI